MYITKAIYDRHTVRHYDGKPLRIEHVKPLKDLIDWINNAHNFKFKLLVSEPKAFNGDKASISNFTGCVNYLALIGPKGKENVRLAGYYGEQIVLEAQKLGVNSCWVALTFNPQMELYEMEKGDELYCVIALGYGTTQGKPHVSKKFYQVSPNRGKLPGWFTQGVKYALYAPTGKNEQGFTFELLDNNVVELKNKSTCSDLDYGILKYHFEVVADPKNFTWKK